jgi:hypothetical protein
MNEYWATFTGVLKTFDTDKIQRHFYILVENSIVLSYVPARKIRQR